MSRDFCYWFLHDSSSPKPLKITLGNFEFFGKFAEIFASQGTPRVSTKLAVNLWPVSTTTVTKQNLWNKFCDWRFFHLQISQKTFETALLGYSGAWGKLIHERNLKSKIYRHCPFKRITWNQWLKGWHGLRSPCLRKKILIQGGIHCTVNYSLEDFIFNRTLLSSTSTQCKKFRLFYKKFHKLTISANPNLIHCFRLLAAKKAEKRLKLPALRIINRENIFFLEILTRGKQTLLGKLNIIVVGFLSGIFSPDRDDF